MNINNVGKPQSTLSRALSIVLFLVVGIVVIALLVNRGFGQKKDYLANGTPINLYTHYKNITDNKYEITTWVGQPTFEEFILASNNIIKVEYVSDDIQEVDGAEQRLYDMRVVDLLHSTDSTIKIGDIIKVRGDMHEEENFSYQIADKTILSLQKQYDDIYFPKNDMMGVFYVIDEKIYPACDVHDFADYIGIKESKFIKKLDKIIN